MTIRFAIELTEREAWVWQRLGTEKALQRVTTPDQCVQCDRLLTLDESEAGQWFCAVCESWAGANATPREADVLHDENIQLRHRLADLETERFVLADTCEQLQQKLREKEAEHEHHQG